MPRNKHRGNKPKLHPVLQAVGPLTSRLKRWWIFPFLVLAGAVVAVVAPLALTQPEWAPLRVVAGSVAALAVLGDRVADAYDKKLSEITFRESERSAEKAVEDLSVFISEAIEATFLSGRAREEALKALRRTLVRQAAGSIGDGSRATYYTLSRETGGSRTLGRPIHHNEHGRSDKPKRPFVEAEDPSHEIWQIMNNADDEPEVRSYPETAYGVNWAKKKYKTFYTVPVKANMVEFGLLSVNNERVGAIGGAQRAVILAMARTFAMVIASERGPAFMNSQAAHYRVSAVASTVASKTEGAAS